MSLLDPSVRQAARRLAGERRYSAAVILILAIGIGPAAAMLAVFYNVLLRPLDYAEPERLALIRLSMGRLVNHAGLSPAEAIDLRTSGLFESVEVQNRVATVSMGPPEQLVSATQLSITTGLLPMLGVNPVLGRHFTEADIPTFAPLPPVAPGAPPPPLPPPPLLRTLLDYGTWQTHFGGDRAIVGRIIQVDGGPAEIIGVLPEGFRLATGRDVPKRIDLYLPLRLVSFRNAWTLPTLVRIRRGTSFAEVQAGMDALASNFRRDHPALYVEQPTFAVTPLLDDLTSSTRPALRAAAAAVALLMLVAFANAATLVVARLKGRETDLAVRTALGASPRALVREVVVESAMLAAAGAAIASLLAIAALAGVRELIPRTVPRWDEIAIDWRLLSYASLLSLAGLVSFGLIPVWKVSRGATITALRSGTAQGGRASRAVSRLVLVSAQMALTIVLAFACVQLLRSAAHLRQVDLGYDPDVLTVRVPYDFRLYNTNERRAALFQRIRNRVRQVPGVVDAGVITHLPLSGSTLMSGYDTDLTRRELSFDLNANYHGVTPGYFAAMGIPVVEGRDFTDQEDTSREPVIIVDEMLARSAFPGQSPLGKTLRVGWGLQTGRIVGVVGHARTIEVGRAVRPQIYAAVGRLGQNPLSLVVRSHGDAQRLSDAVLQAVREMNPGRAVTDTGMLTANVAAATSTVVAVTGLLSVLAASAGLLTAVGLYLVVAYVVHQQRRETAIRTALGATKGQVMWGTLRTSTIVLGVALPIGATLALASGSALASLVYAVGPRDLTSLAIALALTGFVGVIGMLIPVRHALNVNILKTLREA